MPADGYVNGRRGNLPYGFVQSGTEIYISTNGSKVGFCQNTQGKCFEVADKMKGDIARAYFYVATAYEN